MLVKDIITLLEDLAPLSYAEDFDNVGLLVGNENEKVTNVLVTLDSLETVVEEAIEKDCNLIVSFHPIIFKGLKSLTGKTYVERTVLKAIKHNIAIYSMHTALDNAQNGVNDIICKQLELKNTSILIPQKAVLKKLTTYVPHEHAEELRQALFDAGAGNIGNYSHCSFNVKGDGTFKGNADSNPTVGEKGKLHYEPETMVSITFKKHKEGRILNTLFKTHPYEEVAYEVTTLDNSYQNIGIGKIGELKEPMETMNFLNYLKTKMNVSVIRHSDLSTQTIKKVAVLGGSGSFAISAAKRSGADIYITADLKYHDFFSAENQIILADIGHYESEQFTKNFLTDYLSKKITNFAPALSTTKVVLSTTNTNPVKYF